MSRSSTIVGSLLELFRGTVEVVGTVAVAAQGFRGAQRFPERCPRCRMPFTREDRKSARFCRWCAAPVPRGGRCPACGWEDGFGRFCPWDGTELRDDPH